MNNEIPKGAKIFNVIRANASQVYMDTVPEADANNITLIANTLFASDYTAQLNEFANALVNRIGLVMVRNKIFNNPLAMFKKGRMPLGSDVEEIYTNPAKSEEYTLDNNAMADVLAIEKPDTKAIYYRLNSKKKYKVSVANESLRQAFTSWDSLEKFISSMVDSLYSRQYIDEYNNTKKLITEAYENNRAIVQVVDDVVDKSSAEDFILACRENFLNMQEPSSDYNAYSLYNESDTPVVTWTTSDRIRTMMTNKVMATVSVKDLASAFNLDYANFIGQTFTTKDFGNSKIVGAIFDEGWFQIYDNMIQFTTDYNASALIWQYYLHVWTLFALSPIANAIIFATAKATDVTSIDMGSEVTLASGATKDVTVTVTPVGAETDITYKSSKTSVVKVKKNSDLSITLTGVGAGSAIITATAENGITATLSVTVTEA